MAGLARGSAIITPHSSLKQQPRTAVAAAAVTPAAGAAAPPVAITPAAAANPAAAAAVLTAAATPAAVVSSAFLASVASVTSGRRASGRKRKAVNYADMASGSSGSRDDGSFAAPMDTDEDEDDA